jgi:putative ABC transport system permease protein
MIKNYVKTAWRNLLRNKSYAAINVIGLAIGVAACLLIFLIIQFETSFDNFHKKKNQIYRVTTANHGPAGLDLGSGVPFPTAQGLRIDYPMLKEVATIMRNGSAHFTIDRSTNGQPPKKFKEDETYYAEPQFFNEFDFEWLAGDKKTGLSEPNTVVLTQDEAEKFFGSWRDALGKVIKFENRTNLKVTGILKNMPTNTDFPLKVVISYASTRVKGGDFYNNRNDWVSVFGSHYVFVILADNMSVSQFNQDLTAFVKKHKPREYAKDGMLLQPLSDMHYNTQVNIFSRHGFSKELIKAIGLIGLFLLIIACVNFINLATAQAVNRSKEVGIRKVLGSNRKQLILQFISETFIVTIFAVVLAIGIADAMLQLLNNLLEIQLSNSFMSDPVVLLFLAGLIGGVTLLAGFYPALVLSGFNPISALKNKVASGKANGLSLRHVLVVLQFSIAQVLVIGTLVIISQMDYFKNKSLGFAKDAVIVVPIPNDSAALTRLNSLRNQLLQQPGVNGVSYSFASPSDNSGWSTDFKYNNSPKKTDFEANLKWADPDYFNLYKLQFIAGRAYSKTDTVHEYVVNETLLKKLGVRDPKDAIGKYINLWDEKGKNAEIVGVIKDFNVSSLKDQIPPVLMASWKAVYQKINIKIQPANITQTLASVERLWSGTFPDGIYEYQFLDDKIANFYKADDQLSQLYKIFAGIAIFISCLGLYGLVSFMAVQRTKEVGIRKTLGASVANIVYLFSKEFTLLILVAFAISAPIGWYLMNKWLQDFTYRIPLGPGIFLLAIIASVAIAWVTVGYKAIMAALANPVKSLRSE